MELRPDVLVIFDVDGTLTGSSDVDADVNVRVMAQLFDIGDIDTDWSHYQHATDGAIFDECFARRWGRPATSDERSRFEQALGTAMEETLAAAGDRCPAMAGAAGMLSALAGLGPTVALASGAYERSMLAKLRAAALNLTSAPRATGSDAGTREEIVVLARRRAVARRGAAGSGDFARVVAVGDGTWDVRTARRLELPFIGVCGGDRAARARLAAEGAATIIDDFRDLPAFLRALSGTA